MSDLKARLALLDKTLDEAAPSVDVAEIQRRAQRPPVVRDTASWWRTRPVWVAVAAALVTLVLVGGVALVVESGDDIEVPPATAPPVSEPDSTTTTAAPTTTTIAVGAPIIASELVWNQIEDGLNQVEGGLEATDLIGTPHGFFASQRRVTVRSADTVVWSADGHQWDDVAGLAADGGFGLAPITGSDDVIAWSEEEIVRLSFHDGWSVTHRAPTPATFSEVVAGPAGYLAWNDMGNNSLWYAAEDLVFRRVLSPEDLPEIPASGGCETGWGGGSPGLAPPMLYAAMDGFGAFVRWSSNDWTPLCEPTLWFSQDGTSWKLVGTPLGPDEGIHDVASYENRVIAVGSSIWISDGGRSWTQAEEGVTALDGSPPDFYARVVAGPGGWMILVDAGIDDAFVVVSRTGTDWSATARGTPTGWAWGPPSLAVAADSVAVRYFDDLWVAELP